MLEWHKGCCHFIIYIVLLYRVCANTVTAAAASALEPCFKVSVCVCANSAAVAPALAPCLEGICVCVQTLLEAHQGWYQLQRCKYRFEGLLRIDKLKRNAGRAAPAASFRAPATATVIENCPLNCSCQHVICCELCTYQLTKSLVIIMAGLLIPSAIWHVPTMVVIEY